MKINKWVKIAGISLLVIVMIAGAVRIIFDDKFDDFEKYIEAREKYEGNKEEFDQNIKKMSEFKDNYKRENPGTTDEEAEQALRDSINYAEALEKQKAKE